MPHLTISLLAYELIYLNRLSELVWIDWFRSFKTVSAKFFFFLLSLFKAIKIEGINRSSHLEVFLRKGVLKIFSKFTGEHPCRSVISIKLLCNFIEIALRRGCSPVNLLHISRIPFPKNTSKGLLLNLVLCTCFYITLIQIMGKISQKINSDFLLLFRSDVCYNICRNFNSVG